ncbi:vanadium-dependent haloperoxidase [Knoellia sp. Soil729]|uniref:vanadium-dependent haloperoxidase n=1 Tax=Knoellia sp. Soil729 TaxID=1736394 RepID=UPI0006FDA919|nr:vanadium-dependent haloperoxidase [Knoellia sp. Soil729]KRE44040.1 hypothetical protein ASG74_04255 [Knoellia sp. Soil729]
MQTTDTTHTNEGAGRPTRRAILALPVAAGLLASGAVSAPAHAGAPRLAPGAGAAGLVVLDWNRIMLRTFAEPPPAGLPVPVQGLYAGFVGAAVSNAVVAVEGGYAPYVPQAPAARDASVEAAVSTAAREVLGALVPSSAANLEDDLQRWLSQVGDPAARAAGVSAGHQAAALVLAARVGDGRGAPVTLTTTPGPGIWDPPPTGMLVPWLGFVRPMAVPSQTWLGLPGPDPLDSDRYAADFAEVASMGSRTGSARTQEQTENALFYNANAVAQYNVGLRNRLARDGSRAREASRALGLLNITTADALISCWRVKYDVHNWRPQQAIQRAGTDGNTATVADATWEPLVLNPPYGDYASGHACLTGAFSETMANLYGRSRIDVDLFSSITGTTRHYANASAVNQDTKNARIWLGLHFRRAKDDGNRIGRKTADHVVRTVLTPAGS